MNKSIARSVILIILYSSFSLIASSAPNTNKQQPAFHNDPADKSNEIIAFRELEYGMFIHYSLSTFDGKEQTPGNSTPVTIYKPTNLDVEQWIQVASDAGMKYAVLTAKHSSGFCLWDSKVQWKGTEFDYDVGACTDTTDVVAAFMEACKKYDIVPGVYYCAMDTRHSDESIKWTPSLPYISAEYFQLMKDHLSELHTRYPDIAIQWIDIPRHLTSAERDTLYQIVYEHNPACLVEYNYGKESGDIKGKYTIAEAAKVSWPTDILNSEVNTIKYSFEIQQDYMGTTYDLAYEHCISLDDGWFWDEGSKPKSLNTITAEWEKTRRLNGNFLLNVPPDKTGQIPTAFIQRLEEFYDYLNPDTVPSSIAVKEGYNTHHSQLSQNYPNPFGNQTKIRYVLKSSEMVSLTVYNLAGELIETLVNEQQQAGRHEVAWDPAGLPEAIYICKLETSQYCETMKMMYSKTR